MKNFYVVLIFLILVCMLVIPIAAIGEETGDKLPSEPSSSSALSGQETDQAGFTVYLSEKDELLNLSVEDYLFGVIACEMPAEYPDEALKAQIVAAYTVACYQKNTQANDPDPALKGADFSDNPSFHQGFLSREEAQEKWGDAYQENAQRLDSLIEQVKYRAVLYEGQPINAVYYAISSGKTESAAAVWGTDVPYLQPVESVGDLLAPDYLTTVSYTVDEFKEKARSLGIELEGEDPASFLSEPERTQSGLVIKYVLGGKEVTGNQMRETFSLRSANFDLAFADDAFAFTVRGYGHDVGMSQFGAKSMAEKGSNYEEVLNWYYTGCTVEEYPIH